MVATFSLMLWIQSTDKDFKNKSNFDKFKFPVLSTAIVGLLSQYIFENYIKEKITIGEQDIFTEAPDF